MAAMSAVNSKELGREWFDAVALDEAEVAPMESSANWQRWIAAEKARLGFTD